MTAAKSVREAELCSAAELKRVVDMFTVVELPSARVVQRGRLA